MFSNFKRISLSLMMALIMTACVSLASDAEFAADPSKRKQFVESIEVGKTNISELTSRWGNVTSAGTAGSGNRPDQYYNWATGFNPNGSFVSVITSYEGVVKSVISEGPNGRDNFSAGSAVASTSKVQEQSVNTPTTTSEVSTSTQVRTSGNIRPEDLTKPLIDEMRAYANNGATMSQFKQKYGEPTDESSYQRLFVQTVTTLHYGYDGEGYSTHPGPKANWLFIEFTDNQYSGTRSAIADSSGKLQLY